MKKVLCISIALFFCLMVTYAQTYKKVKIIMNNGSMIEGNNGSIEKDAFVYGIKNPNDASFDLQNSVPLSDVSIIQAKKGKAGKWALGCGGGCLGFYIIDFIAVGGSSGIEDLGYSTGQFALGVVVLTVAAAGIGALIGSATDPWNIIYSKNLSELKKINLNFTSGQFARYTPRTNNFTLSYRF
jgi:hypothetical protein